ncbi:Cys-Gln thioester bond-forming surface protein [Streptomyces cinnabarinus]|uniref:Cys-Gln thioester bond-forming surface protein n=1 Tax=Streptomyces cinnabarinus TaxID=67287 RepID=A0ABY7KF84_9ACTN|nr:Cys-Gln thioester bond-forming surface protein [Streptomyces cinnabarinus]WAZ21787.1 Cys-Gln thioester bond-forming surface protein [Streptomyces cinnabarinus]
MLSAFSALSGRGREAARLTAATLVSGLLAAGALVAGAGQAAADGGSQSQGGATATIGGLKTFGAAVIHSDTGDQEISAGLFEMSVEGGGTLQTYCVDLFNPTQKDAKYHETPWSGTSLGANENSGRIRWILQNSYPQVNDLAALARKAGLSGGLSEQDAAAGTQVAVWRYSDGADVDAVDPQAEKLADYLERSAQDLAEPRASLTLDPPALSGHPGERLGPVTVRTGADAVTVTPPAAMSGVRIVDKKGKPVSATTDGGQIWFDVPEEAPDGTAELTVQASTTVPVGRAFTSESRSQTQILAGSSESTVSATASAAWAKQGAIPALSATKNCAEGGVDITAANEGDAPFTFELLGTDYTIAPSETRTVTIPLQEDQAYDFAIEGPGGIAKRFTGVLDCLTQAAEADNTTTQTLTEPSPASVGGTSPDTNLAETGSSNATPVIAGVAIGLVLLGGAFLVMVHNRRTPDRD